MVKENTHLYLASIIKNQLPKKQQNIINKNPNLYYIGSICPDILLYSKKYHDIANKLLHSKPILKVLLKNSTKDDIPFIYGYITHLETDEIFHKILPKDSFKHIYMETSIDKEVCPKRAVKSYLHPEAPMPLIKTINIPKSDFMGVTKKHSRLNTLFLNSRWLYFFVKKTYKPLFYSYIKKPELPNDIGTLFKKAIDNSIKEIKKIK